jgi:Protein of unknown function (DUF998)
MKIKKSMTKINVFRFGWIGASLFLISTILGGLQFSDYSHIKQLISESYAIDSPYGIYLRYLGFMPSGLLMAVFAFGAMKILPKSKLAKIGFFGIGIFYGLATVLVSLFPCDHGCDNELVNPSLSQLIHNLAGTLTYLIVPISLILLGIAARKWDNAKLISALGIICGLVSVLFVNVLAADLHSNFIGLYQRIVEGAILFWIVMCAFYIRNDIAIEK